MKKFIPRVLMVVGLVLVGVGVGGRLAAPVQAAGQQMFYYSDLTLTDLPVDAKVQFFQGGSGALTVDVGIRYTNGTYEVRSYQRERKMLFDQVLPPQVGRVSR